MTTDEAAGPLPFDTSKAHQARIYDYLGRGRAQTPMPTRRARRR
jgi:hypothetical protein